MQIKRSSVLRKFNSGLNKRIARDVIGKIEKNCEIFGLSNGQFSMADILEHVLSEIGPAFVSIITWSAGVEDIRRLVSLKNQKQITGLKFVFDESFQRMRRKYNKEINELLEDIPIKTLKIHAKIMIIKNDGFSLVVRSSMNLNKNPRIEFYEISDDIFLFEQIQNFINKIGLEDPEPGPEKNEESWIDLGFLK